MEHNTRKPGYYRVKVSKIIDPNLPVDSTASRVVSKSHDQGVDFRCGDKVTSMTKLPTTQFTGPRKDDLTGMKCGRFTVIGCALYRAPGRVNTIRWVVRCSCGRYQMLTSKAVKKGHPQTSCVECQSITRRSQNLVTLNTQKP